jgi:phenylalanyl-tRNA synthetase beta chain
MKFTFSWLKEYLDTNASLTEITECLTEIGLEVEEVIDKATLLKDFKVVEVIAVKPHPDADRLKICTVQTAQENFNLVCGASNVTQNMKAILAPLGSIIPSNNMKIKKAKIRGVESIGMLCSAQELGLGEDGDGIIEAPLNSKIGTEVASLFGLNDPIIEIAITPNRGDCLGVYGIARDLAATGIGKLKELDIKIPATGNFASKFKLNVTTPIDINLVEIRNLVNIAAPQWLQNRLKSIDIAPRSALIDITNYVAYCFAQPLHIYDVKKLASPEISVKKLAKEESFLALNDIDYKLPKDALITANQNKILSLAGIIGGKSSACDVESSHILLEAASFDANLITNTGRKLQIDTDSRYRFERNIDPLFVKNALNYAINLIIDICNQNNKAQISQIINHEHKAFIAKNIQLNMANLQMIAASEISKIEASNILEKLGFIIKNSSEKTLDVTVPSWRNDISIEADLIEEILRIRGFNKIPYLPFAAINKIEKNNHNIQGEFAIKKLLANLGLNEVITWSFYSDLDAKNFALTDKLVIKNPISSDLAIMRNSLLVNLVNLAYKAQTKTINYYNIFEYGNIFQSSNEQQDIKEESHIAALRMGQPNKEINNENIANDIFTIKNDIFSLIEFFGIQEEKITLSQKNIDDFLHPKRSARLLLGKKELGYFGELHPEIAKKIGLKQRVNLFELNLANLPKIAKQIKVKKYNPIDLQPVSRDFCFIIDKNIGAGEIKKELYKIDNKLIKEVKIFDLYQGEKIAAQKKSVAYNVILQPVDKSFTTIELEDFNKKVISHITEKFSATLP